MKKTRAVLRFLMLTGLLGGLTISAYAKENVRLMQTIVTPESVRVYVDTGNGLNGVSAQIGRDVCEDIEINSMTETGEEIQTLIFLDNSLSITKENQKKIDDLLQSYIMHKPDQEAVSIYIFGESAKKLTENCSDKEELRKAIEKISYFDQDSWLTDVVYDEIKEYEGNANYTRIIVISDGVDNKAIGYTKEELRELLQETGFPLYAIGCIYKNNQESLENFFALSRQTAGLNFLLDEYENAGEIANALLEDIDISCISVQIPEKIRDGSDKSLLVTLESNGDVWELRTNVKMPFGQNVETEAVQETETQIISEPKETAAQVAAETEYIIAEEESEAGTDWISLFAVIVIVFALAALLIYKMAGTKKKSDQEKKKRRLDVPKEPKRLAAAGSEEKAPVMGETMLLNSGDATQYMGNGGETVVLHSGLRIILCFYDMEHTDKVFRYPLLDNVFIGRASEGNQIILDYDRSVSGRQCRVFERNGCVYIENLSKVNGTCVNGMKITCETPIYTGDTITMGNLKMKVELIEK